MYFRILGSAAGGGLPQWNCHCTNCTLARQRSPQILPRTQCCAAVSADRRHWFLLNASPDMRTQLLELPTEQATTTVRRSPFEAVLLNDADLDHVLGLYVVREGGPLHIHCSGAVREQLTTGLSLERTLLHYCTVAWHTAPAQPRELRRTDGEPSGLLFRALPLDGTGPRYARGSARESGNHVAWEFTDAASGRRLIHAPCIAELIPGLWSALSAADVVTFDGTFYRDDEMERTLAGQATAQEMGHVPVEQSAAVLAELRAKVIYTHLNNTNPLVRDDSVERAHVQRLRLQVAYDGLELEV